MKITKRGYFARYGRSDLCSLAFAAVATACTGSAYGQTVFKCVDPAGKITFTANANCPSNHSLNDVVSARNQTISRGGEETIMAQPRARASNAGSHYSPPAPVQSRQASATTDCSTGLDEQQLRKAKVQGKVVPGMSRDQVEGLYGNATDKRATGGGSTTYWSDHYKQAFSVSFDRNGCVRSTHASGYKP